VDAACRWAAEVLGKPLPAPTFNTDGTSVLVLIFPGNIMVRLARTPAAAGLLTAEAACLRPLAPRLPLAVPQVLAEIPGALLQTYLPGTPLTRRRLLSLPAPQRGYLLDRLADGLDALSAEANLIRRPAPGLHDADDFARLRQQAETVLFPRISGSLRAELQAVLEDQAACPLDEARPGVIHGDLHPSHILVDDEDRLTGLIDFGLCGRADPAVDRAGLWYNWGDAAARHLCRSPEQRQKAKVFARTYEIQWAVEALMNDRPDWLLYAMGAAKAIGAEEA
jgi:macrolide phosphotransferase